MSSIYAPKRSTGLFNDGQPSRWMLTDELAYITGLGTWATTRKTRLQLLESYRGTLATRRDWSDADFDTLAMHVRDEINAELAKGAK